jgi:HSP20 family molecular chaperone IbpA
MSAARQLQLAKRENFFSDPLFKDIWSFEDNDLQKRLETFKNKSALAVPGKADTAHNLQVSCSNDKFMVQLELPGFLPEDFSLKTKDDIILLEAVHEGKAVEGESTSRKFTKEFKVPEGVLKEQLQSSYSSEGILTIHAPRKINAPEGAEVQEAMAAASKAYTTDDGKTAVKQDSSSASQLIATSTKSDDGSFSSSSSFSSSKMSSSTSTTSSTGGMPGMPAMPGT